MNTGSNITLANGLVVSVDWISFTLSDSDEPASAFSLLGYSSNDFTSIDSGRFGYRARLMSVSGGLDILYDGNEGMGVHVDISGSGITDVLAHYLKKRLVIPTPFGSMAYESDFDDSTILSDLLHEIALSGHLTRLDLAIDDHGANFFTLPELNDILNDGRCSSRFRSYDSRVKHDLKAGDVIGYTLYLGSRKSECFLRVYDKMLEQNEKLKNNKQPLLTEPWVRWELELKDERAISAANLIIQRIELGKVVVGILGNYIRLIENDNVRKSRCSNMEKWEKFLCGISHLRLSCPSKLKELDDCIQWLTKQVAPTMAALMVAFEGDMNIFTDLLLNGLERLNKNHKRMILNHRMKLNQREGVR